LLTVPAGAAGLVAAGLLSLPFQSVRLGKEAWLTQTAAFTRQGFGFHPIATAATSGYNVGQPTTS